MTVEQLREQLANFDGGLTVLTRVEWDDDDAIVGVPYQIREILDPDTAERLVYVECEQE
jgi:hypothetical protein